MLGELVAAMAMSKVSVVLAGGDEAELGVEEDVNSKDRGALGL